MADGYIYVLCNPAYRSNLYKIGYTTLRPEDRAWKLYEDASGVPEPFEIAYTHPVSDCWIAEQRIHDALSSSRNSRYREFFNVDLETARDTIRRVCEDVNHEFPENIPPPIIDRERLLVSDPRANTNANGFQYSVPPSSGTKPDMSEATRTAGNGASDANAPTDSRLGAQSALGAKTAPTQNKARARRHIPVVTIVFMLGFALNIGGTIYQYNENGVVNWIFMTLSVFCFLCAIFLSDE